MSLFQTIPKPGPIDLFFVSFSVKAYIAQRTDTDSAVKEMLIGMKDQIEQMIVRSQCVKRNPVDWLNLRIIPDMVKQGIQSSIRR
jgi:hypothetical protein